MQGTPLPLLLSFGNPAAPGAPVGSVSDVISIV
jgi:hypothetical protein